MSQINIDAFPDDVLGDILAQATFSGVEWEPDFDLIHKYLAIDKRRRQLTSVSSLWRTIGVERALLWSVVHLPQEKKPTWLKLCLARSKSTSLFVIISPYPRRGDGDELEARLQQWTKTMFEILQPYSGQVENLFVSLKPRHIHESLLPFIFLAPRLEQFCYQITEYFPKELPIFKIPEETSLMINMSILKIQGMGVNSLSDATCILRNFPSLRVLSVSLKAERYWDDDIQAIEPPIYLPYLEELELNLGHRPELPILPSSFEAPNLRKLTLSGFELSHREYIEKETLAIQSTPNRFPLLSEITIEDAQIDFGAQGDPILGVTTLGADFVRTHRKSMRKIILFAKSDFTWLFSPDRNFFRRAFKLDVDDDITGEPFDIPSTFEEIALYFEYSTKLTRDGVDSIFNECFHGMLSCSSTLKIVWYSENLEINRYMEGLMGTYGDRFRTEGAQDDESGEEDYEEATDDELEGVWGYWS